MNLVSLLIASAVVTIIVGDDQNDAVRILIAVVAVAIIAGAIYVSKQREVTIADDGDNTGSSSFSGHPHVNPAPAPHPAAAPQPASAPAPASEDTAPTQRFEPPPPQ
jgi:hypothetical protein